MTLDAYRCSNLLFVHWKRFGTRPTNFRLLLNQAKLPGPVVGNRLNPDDANEQQILLVAQSDQILACCEIEIIDHNGRVLASRPKQNLPLISNQFVSNLPSGFGKRFWRFLFDYLPKALPSVARSSLLELYSVLIEHETPVVFLPGITLYARIPVLSERGQEITELRVISESKTNNIKPLYALLDCDCMHFLFSADDDLDWRHTIYVAVFNDKSFIPFKAASVVKVPDPVSLVTAIAVDYPGNRMSLERFLLHYLSANLAKSPLYRHTGDSVWRQCFIPNYACEIPEKRLFFKIDDVKTIPGLGTVVVGVGQDPLNVASALVTHNGRRYFVKALVFFDKANDVSGKKMGFAFILPEEPVWNTISFELELNDGTQFELGGIKNQRSFGEQRDWLIAYANWRCLKGQGGTLAEAVAACHERADARVRKPIRGYDFNSTSTKITPAEFTIIIPLYRLNSYLLKTQFAVLAGDEEVQRSEIILMLCQPEWESAVTLEVQNLVQIYHLRIRLVVSSGSIERHIALNEGLSVSNAAGGIVFYLSPDVIPRQNGWLGALRKVLRGEDAVSIAAPLLLSEDGTIAHASYTFELNTNGWERVEPERQRHPVHSEVATTRIVPAISLACAAVNVRHLKSIGGFNESFVSGDYADSEFCFRITKTGGRILMVSEIQMWYFEAPKKNDSNRVGWADYDKFIHPAPC